MDKTGQKPTKSCSKCKLLHPIADYQKHSGTLSGLGSQCRTCRNLYQRTSKAHKESRRRYKLKSKYGITLEDYNVMLRDCDSRCEICRCDVSSDRVHGNLCVDHCHTTLAVRGLLCHQCNTALALLSDDTKNMQAMINYINKQK